MVEDKVKPKARAKPKAAVKADPKPVAKSPKVSPDVEISVLCSHIYNGDRKYLFGASYTVPRGWAESVIAADSNAGRDPRIKLL